MAIDEALMEEARHGRTVLRFYGWDPPCLSFGRNQPAHGLYDAEAAARRGIDVVRRPTGGRAVYHARELTYSVCAPDRQWGGPREAYRRVNEALARGLASLGLAVGLARPEDIAELAPAADACFGAPAPGEVVVATRKLVGSAQWRNRGSLLQHGSILLTDAQTVEAELRSPSAAAASLDAAASSRAAPPSPAVGLAELTSTVPERGLLEVALAGGFELTFGREVRRGPLPERALEEAGRLAVRYRDAAWTWRR